MSNIIFINGCFDVLHVGHFNFLNYCFWVKKQLNLELHIGLDSDTKICLDKGPDRPIFNYLEREKALKLLVIPDRLLGTPMVDYVHKFQNNKELEKIVQSLQPQIMVKGEEWENKVVGKEFCKKVLFYPTSICPLSSSIVIKRILEMNSNENPSMR